MYFGINAWHNGLMDKKTWKYQIPDGTDLGVEWADEGQWRSFQVTEAHGDTVGEFLENIGICEIDQDGGELDAYGYLDAGADVQKAILAMVGLKWEDVQYPDKYLTCPFCTEGMCDNCGGEGGYYANDVAVPEDKRLDHAANHAHEMFWKTVTAHYPEAKTGDFPPDAQAELKAAMKLAIDRWLAFNVRPATVEGRKP